MEEYTNERIAEMVAAQRRFFRTDTGHSGMGAYHGEWGFREFTHPQTRRPENETPPPF